MHLKSHLSFSSKKSGAYPWHQHKRRQCFVHVNANRNCLNWNSFLVASAKLPTTNIQATAPNTHATFAFGEILLCGGALMAHEREVAGQTVEPVLQHRVIDRCRPAVVRHGDDWHQQRQKHEATQARRRRLCRRRYEASFRTVVCHVFMGSPAKCQLTNQTINKITGRGTSKNIEHWTTNKYFGSLTQARKYWNPGFEKRGARENPDVLPNRKAGFGQSAKPAGFGFAFLHLIKYCPY